MTFSHTEAIKAAKTDAELKGCTCDAEITTREVAPRVWDTSIRHDDWCPVLANGDQYGVVVVKP